MGIRSLLVVSCVVFSSALIAAGQPARLAALQEPEPQAGHADRPPPCGGEPCDAVLRGFRAFFDQHPDDLDGNGRACADCHVPGDAFQLSPATVEARFQSLHLRRRGNPDADDPLFRPLDADDLRINGESASDFGNLRQHALVRIVLALPPTLRLIDPSTGQPSAESVVDIWRAVPTVHNVALTGPDEVNNPWFRGPNMFGGFQLDARVGTLQDQAAGALRDHAGIHQAPSSRLLDDLASFQRALFSNHRVQDLAAAVRAGITPLPDPDPPLSPLEQQGKSVFTRACAQCHGGPNQTSAQAPVPRFQDINTECPRPVDSAAVPRWSFAPCAPGIARNARTYQVTVNGITTFRTSDDPGRALLTGFVGGPPPRDDWNKFDVPQLRGISGTAPYFHNNSARSLEDVVDHYMQFFKRLQALTAPGAVPPPPTTTDGRHFDRQPLPEERAALLAYLRVL